VTLSLTNSIGTLTESEQRREHRHQHHGHDERVGVATAKLTPESLTANQGLLTATYSDVTTGTQVVVQQLLRSSFRPS